jgi:hypothetical protein
LIVAPLLCSVAISADAKAKLVNMCLISDNSEVLDNLKVMYRNYAHLKIDQVRKFESLLDAENPQFSNLQHHSRCMVWLLALKHFIGTVDLTDLTKVAGNVFEEEEEAKLKCILDVIYLIRPITDLPVSTIEDPRNGQLPDMIYVSWRFLCRSVKLTQSDNIIHAIEFALESQRYFDLALRMMSSKGHKPSTEDKLFLDAISVHLFHHLATVYGQRPFIKESRYYLKQVSTLSWRSNEVDKFITTLDKGGPIKLNNEDKLCRLLSRCLDLEKVASFMKHPLANNIVEFEQKADMDLDCILKDIMASIDSDMRSGRRADPTLLDYFGVVSMLTKDISSFSKAVEYSKTVINLNYRFSSNIDTERDPSSSLHFDFQNFRDTLCGQQALSIIVLPNEHLACNVMWVLLYHNAGTRLVRSPFSVDVYEGWFRELELIESINKTLLKKKGTMTSDEKREWWEQRSALDKRMESLILSISHFMNGLICLDFKSSDTLTIDGVELDLNGITDKYSLTLLDLVYNSLRFYGTDCISKSLLSEALHKRHVEHEVDNIFVLKPEERLESSSRLLLLGSDLMNLPWEVIFGRALARSIPILNVMPSDGDSLVVTSSSQYIGYIINPSGDLVETEKRFASLINSSSDFIGVSGRAPSENEIIEYLTNSKLYLYCGHGGGDAYLSHGKISKLGKVAPSFLIGCSSGKVQIIGSADPQGLPVAYSKASSNFIVCNLWDVTDKDIDAFAIKLLADMLNAKDQYDPSTVAKLLHNARKECNLQFINGAAPVLYTPIQLVKKPI